MEIQHNCTIEEEGVLVVPKVEVTTTEEGNVMPNVEIVDPLQLLQKDEIPVFVDAQHSQMDEEKDNLLLLNPEETSTEK